MKNMHRKREFWGRIFIRIVNIFHFILTWLTTVEAKFSSIFWRVKLNRGCKFHGRISWWRTPDSTIEIGRNCVFRSGNWSNRVGLNRPCMVSTLRQNAIVSIGDNCGFSGTVIAAADSIMIGSNVLCGANVTISDTDWHHTDPKKRTIESTPTAPIIIKDNVWICMNVTILKGIIIGSDSVIAANSVVTESIPDKVIAAGQPARVIKHL